MNKRPPKKYYWLDFRMGERDGPFDTVKIAQREASRSGADNPIVLLQVSKLKVKKEWRAV